METKEFMKEVVSNAKYLLSDLFTSGFLSVHDNTLEEMDKMSNTCIQCGLIYAGESISELLKELLAGRHRMWQNFDKAVHIYCRLEQYLILCEKKLELDEVKEYLGTFYKRRK